MPVTVKYQSFSVNQSSRFTNQSPWPNGTYSTTQQETLFFNRPSSTYRQKPADLFASGTGRITQKAITSCDSNTRISGGGTVRGMGYPSASLFPLLQVTVPPPSLSREAIYNDIRNELRGQVVNLAMALAEYRQTASLFVAAAKVVSTRGRSLAGALTAKRGVAKTWLGFQYGVKPLVTDMLGAIEELRNASGRSVYLQGRKMRTDQSFTYGRRRVLTSLHSDSWASYDITRSVRMRTKWRAKLNTSMVRNCLTAHGFSNPFALAYELTPYSFVLDWWINVGDVLASLDNLLLVDDLLVIDSTSTVRSEYWDAIPRFYPNGDMLGSGHCTYIDRTDERFATKSISRVNTLQYKPSVSLTHILNGLALLRTAKSRF